MDKYREYLICQERGHVDSGSITGWENHSEYTCDKCGTHYYYERTQKLIEVETTKPRPPKKPKTGEK